MQNPNLLQREPCFREFTWLYKSLTTTIIITMTQPDMDTYTVAGLSAKGAVSHRIEVEGACLPSASTLPTGLRHSFAEKKYADAVRLYADSDISLCEIAKICNVPRAGLSRYIGIYHRELLLKRYGLPTDDFSVKVRKRKGQSSRTYAKYKDAIAACSDLAYIEYNISQIACMFGLNATSLSSQLRFHYQDVIPNREQLRVRLGIADNKHRGARPWCVDAYARAVAMYRDTDMTIPEVAKACNVSMGGLSQHLRFYHKSVIEHKEHRRESSIEGVRKVGKLSGNGNLYGPKPETIAKYAEALELYRNTSMTVQEIVTATHVPKAGFEGYLHQWHRGEKLRRRGCEWDGESEPDLQGTKSYLKSTAGKYAQAIKSLKENPRPVADVAAEFGLHADVFREYLKTHEPELASKHGMMRLADGKLVKRSSVEKYGKAVHEYATSTEPLKSIAQRHGLVYNTLVGYIMRNCPAEREAHQRLVELEMEKNNQNI